MSVFVDDMLLPAAVRNGDHIVRGRWSHLMADTPGELYRFAARLVLKQSWIQKPGTVLEHFDITAGKRARALELGAIPISYGEGAHLTWANPFRPARRTPQANIAAVEHYRAYLAANPDLLRLAREELPGLDLACWCSPSLPCHADLLLAIANPAGPTFPAAAVTPARYRG